MVSAIGASPSIAAIGSGTADGASRLLADAIAQGLVRFDAAGQIEPGLAERWIVIDDGMTYIFRLREARWADGQAVTAEQVVALFSRRIAAGPRNRLSPFLAAVDHAVAMTPQVIEVRLKRPRPDLLKLFAQPDMALLRAAPPAGSGPFRMAGGGDTPLLRPVRDLTRVGPDDDARPRPEDGVRLIGERASRAILRFADKRSDLVEGGGFTDWPLLATTAIAPANIRVDPAAGLFGLAVVTRTGFLAEPQNRAAVAAAIDRAALTGAVRPGWGITETLLPEQLDSAAAPAVPAWAGLAPDARRRFAAAAVANWNEGPVALRVGLPAGPGATLVFAHIAAGLRGVGITASRAGPDEPADLRLVDAVAPYDSARWYLATACLACSDLVDATLLAARDAPTLIERSRLIAQADAAIAQDVPFIPLARPLRWSLVALRLSQWTPNVRAWHPLNRLRLDTN